MKRIALTLILGATLLAFTGCNKAKDPASGGGGEKTTVEGFAAEAKALDTWAEEQKKASSNDPAAGATFVSQLTAKAKAIKTEGLPADLKESWSGVLAGMDKMNGLISQMPKKPEEAIGFFMKNGEEFAKLDTEMKTVTGKFRDVAKKHGIQGLENFGPDDKEPAPEPAPPKAPEPPKAP
jgi:hypothetical protein